MFVRPFRDRGDPVTARRSANAPSPHVFLRHSPHVRHLNPTCNFHIYMHSISYLKTRFMGNMPTSVEPTASAPKAKRKWRSSL
jgi:hypothetical protein